MGPVVGTMGVLQALEAIKVITSGPRSSYEETTRPTLLMFSAYSHPQFRSVRMRSRRPDCAACSAQATVTVQSLSSGSLDYVAFCGATAPVNMLSPEQRVSAAAFSRLPRDGSNTLIDVRDETQYAICALKGSVNVPWTGSAESWLQSARSKGVGPDNGEYLFTVCRFGNDSQLAAKALIEAAKAKDEANDVMPGLEPNVRDIRGGFQAWRAEVDPTWPDY